jgi:hypothetical protein
MSDDGKGKMASDELIRAIENSNSLQDFEDTLLDYTEDDEEMNGSVSMYESTNSVDYEVTFNPSLFHNPLLGGTKAFANTTEEEYVSRSRQDGGRTTPTPGTVGHDDPTDHTQEDQKEVDKVYAQQQKVQKDKRLQTESEVFAAQQDASRIVEQKTKLKEQTRRVKDDVERAARLQQEQEENSRKQQETLQRLRKEKQEREQAKENERKEQDYLHDLKRKTEQHREYTFRTTVDVQEMKKDMHTLLEQKANLQKLMRKRQEEAEAMLKEIEQLEREETAEQRERERRATSKPSWANKMQAEQEKHYNTGTQYVQGPQPQLWETPSVPTVPPHMKARLGTGGTRTSHTEEDNYKTPTTGVRLSAPPPYTGEKKTGAEQIFIASTSNTINGCPTTVRLIPNYSNGNIIGEDAAYKILLTAADGCENTANLFMNQWVTSGGTQTFEVRLANPSGPEIKLAVAFSLQHGVPNLAVITSLDAPNKTYKDVTNSPHTSEQKPTTATSTGRGPIQGTEKDMLTQLKSAAGLNKFAVVNEETAPIVSRLPRAAQHFAGTPRPEHTFDGNREGMSWATFIETIQEQTLGTRDGKTVNAKGGLNEIDGNSLVRYVKAHIKEGSTADGWIKSIKHLSGEHPWNSMLAQGEVRFRLISKDSALARAKNYKQGPKQDLREYKEKIDAMILEADIVMPHNAITYEQVFMEGVTNSKDREELTQYAIKIKKLTLDEEDIQDFITGDRQMAHVIQNKAGWEGSTKSAPVGVHTMGATGDSRDEREDRECFTCHQKGHLKRNCPMTRQMKEETTSCKTCNKKGHTEQECTLCRATGCPENEGKPHKYTQGKCTSNRKRKSDTTDAGRGRATTTATAAPNATRDLGLECKNCPKYRNHTTEQCRYCESCKMRGHLTADCRFKKSA